MVDILNLNIVFTKLGVPRHGRILPLFELGFSELLAVECETLFEQDILCLMVGPQDKLGRPS